MKTITRWAPAFLTEDKRNWQLCAPFAQAQYLYDNQHDAALAVAALIANNTREKIDRVHGEGCYDTLVVKPFKCFEHGDPVSSLSPEKPTQKELSNLIATGMKILLDGITMSPPALEPLFNNEGEPETIWLDLPYTDGRDEWQNVTSFTDPNEARHYAMERFGADRYGKIQILTGGWLPNLEKEILEICDRNIPPRERIELIKKLLKHINHEL